jgi:hypothetical protein
MIQGMISSMSPISSKLIRGAEKDEAQYNPETEMRIPKWLK